MLTFVNTFLLTFGIKFVDKLHVGCSCVGFDGVREHIIKHLEMKNTAHKKI